jgi:hypothetical protein
MKKLLATLALTTLALGSANAAVLVGWDTNGLPGGSNNFGPSPFTATTLLTDVNSSGLIRGSGVSTSGTGALNAWGGSGWMTTSNDAADALFGQKFITFSLSATPGNALSLTQIDPYNIRRSGTGPTTGQWQYQVGAGSFVDLGAPITWGGTTTATGNLQSAIDLSTIAALQDVTDTITFRLLNWGATNVGGTWYINNFQAGDDFLIQGTVTPLNVIPEPSKAILILIGLSTLAARRRRQPIA